MALKKYFALSIIAASVAMSACSSDDDDDNGDMTDGTVDAGGVDAGGVDAGGVDAGGVDAGGVDAGGVDAGGVDAGGVDAGGVDAGGEDGMTDGMEEDLRPDPVTYTPIGDSIIDVARGTDADDDGTFEGGADPLSLLVQTLLPYGDLVDALDDPDGSFTVFAPNNAAFGGVDLSTADDATIRRILSYHVVPTAEGGMALNTGALGEDQALPQTLDTLVEDATVTVQDDGTGTIVVVDSDGSEIAVGEAVVAGNGVVYIINEVLTPPAEEDMGGDEGGDDSGAGGEDTGTVGGGGDAAEGSALAVIQDSDDLSSLEAIVGDRASSLEDTDDTNRSQIVFAPRNGTIDPGATSILAYTVTDGQGTPPGGPAAAGTYTSFADLTGNQGGTKQEFVLAGEGESLTVNGQPAQFVPTTSGPVLYVYGGSSEED